MGTILAMAGLGVLVFATMGVGLIVWFFWWQNTRAYGYVEEHHYYDDGPYGGYEDEVHHHYPDDGPDDDDGPTIDLDAVRVGAQMNIRNYPESGQTTRFKAAQRNRYVLAHGGSSHAWYEFKLLGSQAITWLEWEYDDGLVITQWDNDEIPLSDLGTTVDQLRAMEKSERGSIQHDGVRYNFVNTARAKCYENDGTDGADFQSWTFEADNEEQLLSIMLWQGTGGSATGRLGWYLDESEIQLV